MRDSTAILYSNGIHEKDLTKYAKEHQQNGHCSEYPSILAAVQRYRVAIIMYLINTKARSPKHVVCYKPAEKDIHECQDIHLYLRDNHYQLLQTGQQGATNTQTERRRGKEGKRKVIAGKTNRNATRNDSTGRRRRSRIFKHHTRKSNHHNQKHTWRNRK